MSKLPKRYAWMVVPWSAKGWGYLAVEAEGELLTKIGLLTGDYRPEEGMHPQPEDPLLKEAIGQLGAYLSGGLKRFDLPFELDGTEFQKQVWAELLRIPYGETVSYGEMAERIGKPKAARAIGNAIGAHPLPIIIPCHRVIAADGGLGGYHDQTKRSLKLKCFLLKLEGARRPPDCEKYKRVF